MTMERPDFIRWNQFSRCWWSSISSVLLVFFCLFVVADALQIPSSSSSGHSRRSFVESSSGVLLVGAATLFSEPATATAASSTRVKGAAELDLEFYMRDLMRGNKKEGSIFPSTPPELSPPRQLQGPLVRLLLDEDCTPACLSVQVLIDQVQQGKFVSKSSPESIAQDIQDRVRTFKKRSSRSFQARAPWTNESVLDQYYFDFTAYALWRVAAELLPDYLDRDKFVRKLGERIYDRMIAEKLVKSAEHASLLETVPTALEILRVFQSSQICGGFRIRSSEEDLEFIFDDLDEESLSAGGTVDYLVSVFDPATLGASLQINGEQSRFGPDFVGTTLAALWSASGIRSTWETFFVDPEYRPNPKDYFPNEQLLQFTLSTK